MRGRRRLDDRLLGRSADGQWLADKTKFKAVDILRKFEVPCAPVLSMKEIANDPALRASGSVVEVQQEDRGSYLTVGSPIKFSGFTPKITGAPLPGEHTAEVLTELGYSAEQIAKLRKKGSLDRRAQARRPQSNRRAAAAWSQHTRPHRQCQADRRRSCEGVANRR